jgi:glutamate---cysteine ligase / carboxylate-amine ligase
VTVRKIGVEEELMLVDPATHRLTAVARRAVREHDDGEVQEELFLQMIETNTAPAVAVDDVARSIRAGRRAVGQAARAAGARAVAMALPVLADDGQDVTPDPRYRRIRDEYGELAGQSLACGMHLHVDIADVEEAVAVCDRVRPWLPVLLALSANSPYWRGHDTGHASWRSQIWSRWPTGGPADPFGDPAGYDRTTRLLRAWGAALDPGMLYFDVRPSQNYPTVEIRVADVCTEVDDAVLVAVLGRALVETEARAWRGGGVATQWRADLLKAASWRAARYGAPGPLVHPATLTLAPTREVVAAFVDHVRPALREAGEADVVAHLFEQLLARGNGAVRQRSVHEATGSLEHVVGHLAERTEASWQTPPA